MSRRMQLPRHSRRELDREPGRDGPDPGLPKEPSEYVTFRPKASGLDWIRATRTEGRQPTRSASMPFEPVIRAA